MASYGRDVCLCLVQRLHTGREQGVKQGCDGYSQELLQEVLPRGSPVRKETLLRFYLEGNPLLLPVNIRVYNTVTLWIITRGILSDYYASYYGIFCVCDSCVSCVRSDSIPAVQSPLPQNKVGIPAGLRAWDILPK